MSFHGNVINYQLNRYKVMITLHTVLVLYQKNTACIESCLAIKLCMLFNTNMFIVWNLSHKLLCGKRVQIDYIHMNKYKPAVNSCEHREMYNLLRVEMMMYYLPLLFRVSSVYCLVFSIIGSTPGGSNSHQGPRLIRCPLGFMLTHTQCVQFTQCIYVNNSNMENRDTQPNSISIPMCSLSIIPLSSSQMHISTHAGSYSALKALASDRVPLSEAPSLWPLRSVMAAIAAIDY